MTGEDRRWGGCTDRCGALAHSLERVLDLEQVTVRREHGDRTVVRHGPPTLAGSLIRAAPLASLRRDGADGIDLDQSDLVRL